MLLHISWRCKLSTPCVSTVQILWACSCRFWQISWSNFTSWAPTFKKMYGTVWRAILKITEGLAYGSRFKYTTLNSYDTVPVVYKIALLHMSLSLSCTVQGLSCPGFVRVQIFKLLPVLSSHCILTKIVPVFLLNTCIVCSLDKICYF
jgi:hypothetical protein